MAVILSVDPGPKQSALVYYAPVTKRVLSFQIVRNREAAAEIELEAGRMAGTETAPVTQYLAIELIRSSFGKAAGPELFDTAMWAGRFLGAWLAARPIDSALLIPRVDVKVHLLGKANGGDPEVRKAVIARLTPERTQGVTTHCWAALALAIVAGDRLKCGMRGKEEEMGLVGRPADTAVR